MNSSIEAFLRFARNYKLSGRSIAESIVASVIILTATALFDLLYNQEFVELSCRIEISIVETQLQEAVVIEYSCFD